jgi:hypothetical protein
MVNLPPIDGCRFESYSSGPILVLRAAGDDAFRSVAGEVVPAPRSFVIIDDRESGEVRLEPISYQAALALSPAATHAVFAQVEAARRREDEQRRRQLSRYRFWPRVHVMRPLAGACFDDSADTEIPPTSSPGSASSHPPLPATAADQSERAAPAYRGVGWTDDGSFVWVEDKPRNPAGE